MSINTDQPQFLAELIEESKFFAGADNLDIDCKHGERGEKFYDEIVIDGKVYDYENSRAFSDEQERKR